MSSVVGPTHELDSDLVAGGIDQLLMLQTQAAVLRCYTAHVNAGIYKEHT